MLILLYVVFLLFLSLVLGYYSQIKATIIFLAKGETAILMEKQEKILDELREIKRSLWDVHRRMDELEKKQKKPFLLWDIIRSLLIGLFAVGPAIIIVMVLWQFVLNWTGL